MVVGNLLSSFRNVVHVYHGVSEGVTELRRTEQEIQDGVDLECKIVELITKSHQEFIKYPFYPAEKQHH